VHGREHGVVTVGRVDVTSIDACMAERAQGMAQHGAVHPRGGWLLACQSQDLEEGCIRCRVRKHKRMPLEGDWTMRQVGFDEWW